MAKKKDNDILGKINPRNEIRDETIKVIFAVFSFLIVVLSLLASFGKAGWIGNIMFDFFFKLFGVGYFLIPMMFVMLGISALQGLKKKFEISKIFGGLLFLFSGLGVINLIHNEPSGSIGKIVASLMIKILDVWATTAILIAGLIISIIVTFDIHFTIDDFAFWRKKKDGEIKDVKITNETEDDKKFLEKARIEQSQKNNESQNSVDSIKIATATKKKAVIENEEEGLEAFIKTPAFYRLKPFTPPPLSLLEKDKGKPETGNIKDNANIIKRTLQNFNISVEMDEVSIGPSVTRYSLKPAEGVKLSKIVGLNNDLALALASHPIRIEAPIPGKSLVGIEVPNTAKTTVGLATLLSSSTFQESEKPLLMSLGKDITGQPHFANLAKAPHMLIAGTTGSGKSVTIHALITSLLYRNSPENLRFIMIDPKRVELTMYNNIPHLATPVITDPRKAIMILRQTAKEMNRRYDILQTYSSRDIDSYHKTILAPALEKFRKETEDLNDEEKDEYIKNTKLPETMPYIVIIIDELADIMQTYPRELEAGIVRLAQMSRAVGIHLIISTQRPSVNVITGLIKANIPSRIALQVSSQIDSRTILDQMGAEKLLGAGDMLYLGGDMSKPIRLQSAYISESEVKRVVKDLIDKYKNEIIETLNLDFAEPGSSAAFDSATLSLDDHEDDLYETARELILKEKKASTSFLQRKLGIGYNRSAKLIDMLESRGIIGPLNGSKSRDILEISDNVGSATSETEDTEQKEENQVF